MLVLIPGISGSMGRRLATAATVRGLQVRGLGRDVTKVPKDVLLESFVTSSSYYDVTAIEKAVLGVDAIICAYASTPVLDLDGHLILLRAAERAGVKIFISASWNNDWTKNKLGEFEHYDAHIAFRHQAAVTSTIKPVYLFNGFFSDLLFTPAGPGGFDTSGQVPTLKYWGDDSTLKFWWTTQDDAAAWTIEALFDQSVQAGEGGIFRFRSGEASLDELAEAYFKATGTKVEVAYAGSLEELAHTVALLRHQKNLSQYWEYALPALALHSFRGTWTIPSEEIATISLGRKPATLEEVLARRFN